MRLVDVHYSDYGKHVYHSFDKAMNHHDQSSIVNRIDDDDLSNVYHVDLVVSMIEIVNLNYVVDDILDYVIDFSNNDVYCIDRRNDGYCTNLGNLDDEAMANDNAMESVVRRSFSVEPNSIRPVNRRQLFHRLLSTLVLHRLDVES